MRCVALYFFIFVLALPHFACALTFGQNVQVHGFLSQGYLKSSNNNFLAASRSGSEEFTEVALNANVSFLQDFRIGGQLFYRNLGDYSEDEVVVDWAILEYQPFDSVGLRVGKCKLPFGLYNDTRDSSFLQPMIFLPQSIYDESRRDVNLAFIGADLFGNISLGRFGDVDYHLFTGQADYPDQSILAYKNEESVESIIARNNKLPLNKRDSQIPSQLTSFDRESEDLYGGAVVFNGLINGLRLGATLLHSKSLMKINHLSDPIGESITHSKYVLSAEYSYDSWMLVGEYSQTDRTSTMFGSVNLDGPSQSWYAMIYYTLNDAWSFSLLYDEFYRLKHDHHSDSFPKSPPESGWRKDIAVGARYDFNEMCNLKAEYHYIDGSAMQLGVVNPDGVARYWSYVAVKLSVSF
ncbi:MAG: hypothetical protein BA874_10870 [Desulfuromonadales bacterium C00003068]|jgi:hypothetical protein|nr:MAG: hypothetical protein BA874_10870 [Desulfuromonadales bacterium C00003068]